MKSFKNFIKSLLSSTGDSISSKRFIAILGAFVMFFAMIMDILYKKTLTQFMWESFLIFLATLLGMNTVLSFKALHAKETISENIVKEEPEQDSADSAQAVLESDKP